MVILNLSSLSLTDNASALSSDQLKKGHLMEKLIEVWTPDIPTKLGMIL